MKIDTIVKMVKESQNFANTLLVNPNSIYSLMTLSYLFKIILFSCSIVCLTVLFFLKPDSFIWYLASVIFSIFSFSSIFNYKSYFEKFIEYYLLKITIINKICDMSDDDAKEYISGLNNSKFILSQRDEVLKYEKNRT